MVEWIGWNQVELAEDGANLGGSYAIVQMDADYIHLHDGGRGLFAGQMADVRSRARGWGTRGEYVGKWQRAFREAVARAERSGHVHGAHCERSRMQQ